RLRHRRARARPHRRGASEVRLRSGHRHPRPRRGRALRPCRGAHRRQDQRRGGPLVSAAARLAFAGLVRSPGRTLTRVVVLAAAVALLGAMLLFVDHSLRTMTGSAVRSVPLDWQGPVVSYPQAQKVAAGVARQPGILQASATATAPFAGASHAGAGGTTSAGRGAILAVPPGY